MTRLFLVPFLLVALSATAQDTQTFTGVVTDSECTSANHATMAMGPTDADCAAACVYAHGASYVLYDGKTAYVLSDQKSPAPFAGKRVVVTGTFDAQAKRIVVQSIKAAG